MEDDTERWGQVRVDPQPSHSGAFERRCVLQVADGAEGGIERFMLCFPGKFSQQTADSQG